MSDAPCTTSRCPNVGTRWAIHSLQVPFGFSSSSSGFTANPTWAPSPFQPVTTPLPLYPVITSGSYTIRVPYWVCDRCAETHKVVGADIQPELP